MEPIINSQVPEFKVQAFQNGSFKTVSSEDIKGKWAIFFFYPADFTFVCPTELVDMADKYGKFQEMGVEVYSVSTDSHFVHKAWHDASETIRKIKYPMLADPTGALSRAFGVMIEEEGMAYRGTFLVNPEGKIKIAEIHDNGIGRNADELLRKVEAAQFVASHPNEVCPAKWKKGEATLKPSIDLVGKIKETSSEQAVGTVVEQSLKEGHKVDPDEKDRTITLTVSSGIKIEVPNVKGMDIDAAATLLTNKGFSVKRETLPTPTDPNEIEKITVNQVVRQSLDAFTTVTKKNESITLYYYNYKPEIPTDD